MAIGSVPKSHNDVLHMVLAYNKYFKGGWKHPANVYLKPLYQALPCVVGAMEEEKEKKANLSGFNNSAEFTGEQIVHQEVIQVRVVLMWCLEMLLVISCVLLPVQTNMYSEIMAIQLAAEICVHKGFTNVVIEIDSTIARLIMIQEEGNVMEDSLANYAIDEEISGTFEEFHQLLAQARNLINVDKAQIPSFRVRVHPWRF
ncbi:hypothetical protein HAX54_032433 [Datura stramonium]|uniref:RNase H type-1 domain-containing protein n=1 Tax=Datura stramonium TaxID=4076 RepID=A0ABS8VC30_DATST|nr:hypothetical protein [Datura stramonium]